MNVGYARLSITDENPEVQLAALNIANCKPIFIEQKNGRGSARPELNRCLKALQQGDTLTVWRLDRLGRSLRDLIDIVAQLEDCGIQFVSIVEKINTKTANGRLIFYVFSKLAEFETNLIRERTKAGLATARARGKVGGAKKKTTNAQDKQLQALWATGKYSSTELARRFDISLPTFFRRAQAAKR
jgi:DNA invertase Pin-like site-specific DNA recombinase